MKKVLILNGNPNENSEFDGYLEELSKSIKDQGNEVREIVLRQKNIEDCIGCYTCWLKTPGICVFHDDQEEVLKGYVWADFIIIASPVIMGFVSAIAKKSHDRIIPLVHPFLKINNDRMSHLPRYDKKYNLGLMLDNVEEDDFNIIRKVYDNAVFIKTMNESAKEVAYEINNF